jgi:hypothetical protein
MNDTAALGCGCRGSEASITVAPWCSCRGVLWSCFLNHQ